ncbi:MAG: acyl carrier protein [Deltaproteobacteria bacterium]|nr:acyl carrier protein [Deltaproteobacteria bacterium]
MTLEEKVIEIISEQLGIPKEECVPTAAFIEDLGADSLDLFELVMTMEEAFHTVISDAEIKKIRTVRDIMDFLRNKGVS